jgi:HAD superfamily hydrolase (TIGR01509 family)
MRAIIFGGIGTIANTSYLQRKAFNTAFEQLSIEWHWGEEEYRRLIVETGGKSRIDQYNKKYGGLPKGTSSEQVHELKSNLFHHFMNNSKLPLRRGVKWVLDHAKFNNIKLGFATTTSRKNIEILLSSTGLEPSTFHIISNRALVDAPKPEPEIYHYCLKKLNVSAKNSVAIEDASSGVEAAVSAGIKCVAFPNEFTANHNYTRAIEKTGDLRESAYLSAFFASQEALIKNK